MKKKGIIAIIIAIILVVLVIGGIAITIAKNFSQELAIKKEIQEIDQITSDIETINIAEFNQKTDTIVTTGNFAIVEKSVKQYLKDSINYTLEIRTLLQDEKMGNLVTAENYKTDGPDFVETTKYINESKSKLEEAKNTFTNMFSEEKVMSYIEGKTDNKKFIDLYKEVAIGNEEELISKGELETVQTSLTTVIDILNIEDEIITLLKDNKNKWTIQNNMVLFNSNDLLAKYNELANKLQLVATKL